MGDPKAGPVRLSFNPQLRVEIHGATVTSDAELLLPRELDERLGLSARIERHLTDPRTGRNRQQRLFKTGGRVIRHARYFALHLAENYLTGPLFRQILGRIERLAWHPT